MLEAPGPRRQQIGMMQLLVVRCYPLDPADDPDSPDTTVGQMPPGFYPVYHELDADQIYWEGPAVPSCWVQAGPHTEDVPDSELKLIRPGGGCFVPNGDPILTLQSPRFSPTEFFAMLGEQIIRERLNYQPQGKQPIGRRRVILGKVEDVITDFLYYDRKEDEDLRPGQIEAALAAGELTVDDIAIEFTNQLRRALPS